MQFDWDNIQQNGVASDGKSSYVLVHKHNGRDVWIPLGGDYKKAYRDHVNSIRKTKGLNDLQPKSIPMKYPPGAVKSADLKGKSYENINEVVAIGVPNAEYQVHHQAYGRKANSEGFPVQRSRKVKADSEGRIRLPKSKKWPYNPEHELIAGQLTGKGIVAKSGQVTVPPKPPLKTSKSDAKKMPNTILGQDQGDPCNHPQSVTTTVYGTDTSIVDKLKWDMFRAAGACQHNKLVAEMMGGKETITFTSSRPDVNSPYTQAPGGSSSNTGGSSSSTGGSSSSTGGSSSSTNTIGGSGNVSVSVDSVSGTPGPGTGGNSGFTNTIGGSGNVSVSVDSVSGP